MKHTLFVSLMALGTLFTGCANNYNAGRDMPMNVFLDLFPPLLDARYMTGAEATVEVSQGECVALSDHTIRAATSFSLKGDMQKGADDLAGRIKNTGGNAYVLNGFRWLDTSTLYTQLHIDASSFLCD